MSTNSLFALVAIGCTLALRWDLIRANHEFEVGKRTRPHETDRGRSEDGDCVNQVENPADLKSFRYVT